MSYLAATLASAPLIIVGWVLLDRSKLHEWRQPLLACVVIAAAPWVFLGMLKVLS